MQTTDNYQGPPRRLSAFPPVIEAVIITCVAVFALQLWSATSEWVWTYGALWPIGSTTQIGDVIIQRVPPFEIWQVLSYGFMHGNVPHLLINMFAFWMFGTAIEQLWGSRRFAIYFLTCVIGAGLIQLVVSYGTLAPTVGASGGVFGVLLAFGMMYPNQRIFFLLIPYPIKAKYFVIGYGAVELFLGVSNLATGIAHFAHLGGMLFGFILIQYWRGKLPIKPGTAR